MRGDIKKKYPNASIKPVKAAWVTDRNGFFELSGVGFPGQLFIAFDDTRPMFRQLLNSDRERAAAESPPREPNQTFARLAAESDDDAYTVDWVRWVPSSSIPMERYRSKYGEPTKCDFHEDDMRPFCSWDSRKLFVNTSDDKKLVLSVEASFTRAELRAAHVAKGHGVPEWLREEVPAKPQHVAKTPTPSLKK